MWASRAWPSWQRVKDRKPPPVKPIWISDSVIERSVRWGHKQDQPAIIWYQWRAVGEKLAAHFPHYGQGTDAGTATAPVIVCSINSQGTGKNLQRYCRNLFISVPPNGTKVEQTTARTHRPGQLADEVIVDWFGFNDQAMAKAIEDAEYMQQTTGQRQKILYATKA
jgi:hypothetical protein